MHEFLNKVVPSPDTAAAYRRQGWWREETFVDDLRRRAKEAPHRPAFVGWRHGSESEDVFTFEDWATQTARFAAGLKELGVRMGQPVVYQLPSWWEAAVLTTACMWLGAVAVPLSTVLRGRELERVLSATDAPVCVTVDAWQGHSHARMLADLARRRPSLRRVVLGDSKSTGAVDFDEIFTSTGPGLPARTLDPDRVAVALFTSGTTGTAKGVLHSFNTLSTAIRASRGPSRPVRLTTTAPIAGAAGVHHLVLGPLVHGNTAIVAPRYDPGLLLDLMARRRTDRLLSCPPHLRELAEQQKAQPRPLALSSVLSAGSPLMRDDLALTRQELCDSVTNAWGMTEAMGSGCTTAGYPPDWAARSLGRPRPGLEVGLTRAEDLPDGTCGLRVRGPSVCLGTFARDTGTLTWDPAATDGWLETGDLVRADGRGGYRYVGRVAERVSAGPMMIPAADVENELRSHPSVRDVAVVGYIGPHGGERPCAVVVPEQHPPTLDQLRAYLTSTGMTENYQPTRLEIASHLPRNPMGKINKTLLRERIATGDLPL
ncbi:AMP-binding protein [Streptomyces sp. x-19]|uniref:AMP-binding protein n=1 Tax=Streptomyces sp. x-19 TaxID=2789280 RepID=UPI00397EB889